MSTALVAQLLATVVTIVWASIASYIMVKVVPSIVGLRVGVDEKTEGLDLTYHGERDYDL